MVDGTMYLVDAVRPSDRARSGDGPRALDVRRRRSIAAATGATSRIAASRRGSTRARRRDRACRRRIYLGTIDARIIALDARRRRAVPRLRRQRRRRSQGAGCATRRSSRGEYELTSPPAVINGLIVTGSAVADNNRTNAASGEVRAFDARTGALKWTWDPVPRDSTDPASRAGAARWRAPTGAANAWSVIAADSARDLVFVPTGSPSPDYYGGERTRRQPLRQLDRRAARVDGEGRLALPDRASRPLGLRQRVAAGARDDRRATAGASTSCCRRRRPASSSCSIARRASRSSPSKSARFRRARSRRARVADAAVQHRHSPAQPAALRASTASGASPTPIATPAARSCAGCATKARSRRRASQGTLVMPSNIGGAHWGGVAVRSRRGRSPSCRSTASPRWCSSSRATGFDRDRARPIRAAGRSVHAHARHAVRHARRI